MWLAAIFITENPIIFYAVLSAYRNKGYMKRALRLIKKPQFTFSYHSD